MARMCMWYIYTSRVEPNKRFYALATVTQRGCTLNSLVGLSQIKAFMPWLHRELSPKRCDRLNIFKTITVQKNPIVLTGCKRCSDLTFLSSQISTFGMVIVCTGTDHRRRSVEIYVGLSSQCSNSHTARLYAEFSVGLSQIKAFLPRQQSHSAVVR